MPASHGFALPGTVTVCAVALDAADAATSVATRIAGRKEAKRFDRTERRKVWIAMKQILVKALTG